MAARVPGRPRIDEQRFAQVVREEHLTLPQLAARFGISYKAAFVLRKKVRAA